MLNEHELVAQGRAFWYRGRLIPIISGGDGTDEPLFTLPPDDLTNLEEDELAAFAENIRARMAEVFAGRREPDVVGERTRSEVRDEMRAADAVLEAIDAELAARQQDDEEYDNDLTAIAARAGVAETLASSESETGETATEGEGDGDGDGDGGDGEGDGEEEPEATTERLY